SQFSPSPDDQHFLNLREHLAMIGHTRCFNLIKIHTTSNCIARSARRVPLCRLVSRILYSVHQRFDFLAEEVIYLQRYSAAEWNLISDDSCRVEWIGVILL